LIEKDQIISGIKRSEASLYRGVVANIHGAVSRKGGIRSEGDRSYRHSPVLE